MSRYSSLNSLLANFTLFSKVGSSAKKDALNTLAQALATKAYEKAQQAQEATAGANENAEESTQDDNVVDAEFEEVD